MLVFNGKFGGGRMILSPTSMINDGKFEIYMANKVFSTPKLIKVFDESRKGGEHFYDSDGSIFSVKKLRLENRSK